MPGTSTGSLNATVNPVGGTTVTDCSLGDTVSSELIPDSPLPVSAYAPHDNNKDTITVEIPAHLINRASL
jgi:hypothetical protein